MQCPICFEEKNELYTLEHINMHTIRTHKLCNTCFYKLRKPICPFCRQYIYLYKYYKTNTVLCPSFPQFIEIRNYSSSTLLSGYQNK